MSICYISEIRESESDSKTAMLKARQDVEAVFDSIGIERVAFPAVHDGRVTASAFAKIEEHVRGLALWERALAGFGAGDTVFIQYPPLNPCIWMYRALEACAGRGVRIALVVHDLVCIHTMHGDDVPTWHKAIYVREERRALAAAWRASVHTQPMREEVTRLFGTNPDKLITLGAFDYLIAECDIPNERAGKDAPLIVAGNLAHNKAGYLYELPRELQANLFGIGFDEARGTRNLSYRGSYPADELPQHLAGSFGIVWDGPSADTCEGAYGDYLRYNSPHKMSLYLACGMPVIIWEEAAQAGFVRQHNVGLAVNSLHELPAIIESLTEEEYAAMRASAARMGRKLRSGWHTLHFVNALG